MTNAQEIESLPMPIKKPADPFVADLFGSGKQNITERSEDVAKVRELDVKRQERSPSWVDELPKVSRKTLEFSSLLEKLPDALSDQLSQAIAGALQSFVLPERGRVSCALTSIAECEVLPEVKSFDGTNDIALHIVSEPKRADAVVFVGNGFVEEITDHLFGPSGYRSSGLPSPIETAIVEFLAAKIVANINAALGGTAFLVGGVSLSPEELFDEHERGAKACIVIQNDGSRHALHMLLSRRFLSGLEKGSDLTSAPREKAANVIRLIPKVDLRAQIGSTRLDAASISFLEPGDIVILEESQLDWNNGSPRGPLNLLVGAGTNFLLSGTIKSGMRVVVNEILNREAVDRPARAGSIMDEKKTNTPDLEEGSNDVAGLPESGEIISTALENIQLRLRVELAGNKMSLRELNNLRVGQVIDLGRGPNDSVTLITDGGEEPVAVGELVDVEGQLGVRLTKVFV